MIGINNDAAFPMATHSGWERLQGGMTLRDYFAGQALIGLLSGRRPGVNYHAEEAAALSYHVADAMLAHRATEQGA